MFTVSWVAKFFTIFGVDETFIKEKNENLKKAYPAINVITVSPYKEFEKDLTLLLNAIKIGFPDYQFIPFSLSQLFVKDLYTISSNFNEATIYSAFFDGFFDYINKPFFRGDEFFGYDDCNVGPNTL